MTRTSKIRRVTIVITPKEEGGSLPPDLPLQELLAQAEEGFYSLHAEVGFDMAQEVEVDAPTDRPGVV